MQYNTKQSKQSKDQKRAKGVPSITAIILRPAIALKSFIYNKHMYANEE